MVPDKSFKAGNWWEYSKTIFCISYLIMGMIILTMCFSLIGEVVENKVKTMAKKLGLDDNKLTLEEVVAKQRRVSFGTIDKVEEFVPETTEDDEEIENEHENFDNDAKENTEEENNETSTVDEEMEVDAEDEIYSM